MSAAALLFDAETSRRVEAAYLTPDVVAQRQKVLSVLALRQGERVLDVGSGPGLLAHEMAATVGPNGRVRGIDISEDMLALSRNRCAEQPWTEFQRADASKLPYADGDFDAAVSTQVYEYVPDVPAALAELYRVMRPGGRVLILDTDYGSLIINTDNEERLARILDAWDEHFVHPALPRVLSRHLRDAGFVIRRREALPMFNPEYRDDTFAKSVLSLMASFAIGRKGVSEAEARAWLAEFAELEAQGRFFFSLNRYLFAAEKPASS
jgi:arsenite methyltransferase